MKILVTGSAGFLGSHLAEELLKEDHEVFGVDSMIGGDYENIQHIVAKVQNYMLDTGDFDKMDWLLERIKPEVIYHCACTAYEGLSVFSPSLIAQNTFQNTIGILSAGIKHKIKRFIFCSSMARYGKQGTPFTEDMKTEPEDPYGVSKVAAETLIKMMAEQHGFKYAIAVPHNIIGPRQKYDDPYRNVASIMINRMLRNEPPIIYGDGEQTRSFSFVDDCIYSLKRMIDCPSGEIYNIGPDKKDGEVTSINKLYKIIKSIIGYKGEPMYMSDRPREVKHAHCSSDKIRKEFGYKTSTPLVVGLRKMVDDIKEKGTREFKYHLPIEIEEGCPATWTKKII